MSFASVFLYTDASTDAFVTRDPESSFIAWSRMVTKDWRACSFLLVLATLHENGNEQNTLLLREERSTLNGGSYAFFPRAGWVCQLDLAERSKKRLEAYYEEVQTAQNMLLGRSHWRRDHTNSMRTSPLNAARSQRNKQRRRKEQATPSQMSVSVGQLTPNTHCGQCSLTKTKPLTHFAMTPGYPEQPMRTNSPSGSCLL